MARGGTQSKRTVGITHQSLEEEQENQARVPPRGQAKQGSGTTAKDRKRHESLLKSPGISEEEVNRLSGRGGKGGKAGGSRAGLVSFSEEKRRSKGKGLSERPPGHRDRVADGDAES